MGQTPNKTVERMPEKTARKGLIHGIAKCRNCDWRCGDYLTVEKKAADHARRFGHKVTADLGYVVEYGG